MKARLIRFSRRWPLVVLVMVLALSLSCSLVVRAQEPDPDGVTSPLAPLGTSFSYQGQVKKNGSPFQGTCDFQFTLFTASSFGSQIGTIQSISNVPVASGLFTVNLNFGSGVFTGEARFLQIALRCPAATGSFETLTTRQPLNATPYALFALGVKSPQNTVVVAKSGGDFTSLGQVVTALKTGKIPSPLPTSPLHIWIAPGLYTEVIDLQQLSFIHIQGAGPDATILTSAASGTTLPPIQTNPTGPTVLIRASSGIRISDLTVVNTGTGTFSYGIGVTNMVLRGLTVETVDPFTPLAPTATFQADVILDNVEVDVKGIAGEQHMGIYLNSTPPVLVRNSTINVTGAISTTNVGIAIDRSTSPPVVPQGITSAPLIRDNLIYVEGGTNSRTIRLFSSDINLTNAVTLLPKIINTQLGGGPISSEISNAGTTCTIDIHNSQITGVPGGPDIQQEGLCNIRVAGSQLASGGVLDLTGSANPGTVRCTFVYRADYSGETNACPTIFVP
ncbi:MAG: hypothetical protein H0T73_05980 [Ardenticatenales bacterium]|nr:hypothetical protein [Ardenticatenales bacterium]